MKILVLLVLFTAIPQGLSIGEECKVVIDITFYTMQTLYIGFIAPSSDCIATKFKAKYSISGEITYFDVPTDANQIAIHLANPIYCKDNTRVSIIVYDDDGLEVAESDTKRVPVDCSECEATITEVVYDNQALQVIASFIPPSSNCSDSALKIKTSFNAETVYHDAIGNTLGIIPLSKAISSCRDYPTVSIVTYDADGFELVESKSAIAPKYCEECNTKIIETVYDREALQVIVSFSPPSSGCVAKSFKVKCSIGDEISDFNMIGDTLGIIPLSKPISCGAIINVYITGYDENGSELVKLDDTYVMVDCKN